MYIEYEYPTGEVGIMSFHRDVAAVHWIICPGCSSLWLASPSHIQLPCQRQKLLMTESLFIGLVLGCPFVGLKSLGVIVRVSWIQKNHGCVKWEFVIGMIKEGILNHPTPKNNSPVVRRQCGRVSKEEQVFKRILRTFFPPAVGLSVAWR